MRNKQLKAFDTVALEGSFSEAAIRLGITQPAVTYQVRTLEQEYGCLLFVRGATGVKLTEEGHKLLKITRRLFTAEEEAKEFLDATEQVATGNLRIAADAPQFVLDLLENFVPNYPKVQISIGFGNSREVVKELLEKRVDVIVTGNPALDDRLAVVPFHSHPLCAVLPINHVNANQKMIDIRTLPTERFLLREKISTTRMEVEGYFKEINFTPSSVLELGGREATKEAVAKEFGIGFMFEREAEGDARIKAIPLAESTVKSVNSVVCLKNQLHRPVIRELFETATKMSI
ncbi:hypothetical protein A9Q97_01470 [Rhodospirillales bacterium 47_12_T64]|nr:hypothetical protein A9Q97_01470 [Rhodospirillales bacterium 47_12_T64]